MTTEQEKLDNYFPPPEAIAGVRQQLLTAGVAAENLPEDLIPAVLAAASKWMQTTTDGLHFGARLFHFEVDRGQDNRQYEITHYEKCQGRDFCLNPEHCMPERTGRPSRCLRELQPVVKEVKSTDIYFFHGCIAERRPVSPVAVDSYEKEKNTCELCTITAHCVSQVTEAYSKIKTDQCNRCRSASYALTKAEAHPSCDGCSVVRCLHHPRRGLGEI